MTWVAVAIGGSALIGGIMSSNASNNATNAATNAANQSNATQWDMYNQNRTDQAPWRDAGGQAVNQLATGLAPGGQFSTNFSNADFQTDPGYQFALDQGNQALARVGAAKGNSLSGAQIKGATDYNQGMANQQYTNAYNRFMENRTTNVGELSNLAGLGQSSVAQTGQAGTQTGQITGNNTMGAATVAGNAGMANAGTWGNALNNGTNQWMNYSMMQNMYPSINGSYGQGLGVGSQGSDMSGQMGGSNYVPYPTITG